MMGTRGENGMTINGTNGTTPSATTATGVQSSNISIMSEGRIFMSYDGTDAPKPLFLYYLNDSKLGSFIAQPPDTLSNKGVNNSNASTDRLRIPLHMITDVFLGRQSPLF